MRIDETLTEIIKRKIPYDVDDIEETDITVNALGDNRWAVKIDGEYDLEEISSIRGTINHEVMINRASGTFSPGVDELHVEEDHVLFQISC